MRGSVFVLSLLLLLLQRASASCWVPGLQGTYYNGITLATNSYVFYTNIENVNASWSTFGPGGGVPATQFSVRWSGQITPPATGRYVFRANVDDSVRVYVDGVKIIDQWGTSQAVTTNLDSSAAGISLNASLWYDFAFEYLQKTGTASAIAKWSLAGSNSFSVIPLANFRSNGCTLLTQGPTLLSDSAGATPFQFTLGALPQSSVKATLISKNNYLLFTQCSVSLTPDDFDAPHVVTVVANPSSSQGTGTAFTTLTINLTSSDPNFNGQSLTLPLARSNSPGSRAIAWTLSHFTTFDSTRYEIYGLGDFYFVRQFNSEFVVQIRRTKVGSVAITSAIAIKFRGAVFYVYLNSLGLPTAYISGDVSAEQAYVQTRNRDFYFTTYTGVNVNIKVGRIDSQSQYYLSAIVFLPASYKGQVSGLAGLYDGSAANDLSLPTGVLASSTAAFQTSWRVANSENLFGSATPTIPNLPGAKASTWQLLTYCGAAPVIVGDVSAQLVANALLTGFPTFLSAAVGTFDTSFVGAAPTFASGTIQTAAQTACASNLQSNNLGAACNSLVASSNYYDRCISDYAFSSDASLVVDAMNAYYAECTTLALFTGVLPGGANYQVLACPNFCNLKGTCGSTSQCTCSTGFTGADCGEDSSKLPKTNAVAPTRSGGACTTQITFYGEFFPTQPRCKFGTFFSPTSTWISRWQMLCSVPPQSSFFGTLPASITRNGVNDGTAANFTYIETCCDNPCAHGTCIGNSAEPFTCSCGPAWNGTRCQNSLDLCLNNPCKNGGICSSFPGGFNCSCNAALLQPICLTCKVNLPPQISIPASGRSSFLLSLNGQPSSDVVVRLSSSCAYVSSCVVIFNSTNWNIPVNITVGSNDASNLYTCNLTATVTGDIACNGTVLNSTVTRTDPVLYCAISAGDPHYNTFDGAVLENLNLGDYYATRTLDGTYAVQTRLDTCALASCNYGVAIKYKSFVFYVYADKVSGAVQTFNYGSAAAEGVTITFAQNKYTLTGPNGAQTLVGINRSKITKLYFLDVRVCVPPRFAGQLVGLLGYFSFNSTDEFLLADGTLATSITQFKASWYIQASEDLFIDGAAVLPVLRVSYKYKVPDSTPAASTFVTDDSCKPPPSPTLAPTNPPLPPPPEPIPEPTCETLNATIKAPAIAACNPYFNDSTALCCKSYGVSGNNQYRSCVCDYALSGDISFVTNNAQSFIDDCTATLTRLGVSCRPCPNSCSGQGTCNNGTCNCTTGFKGDDCGEDWTTPPTSTLITAANCPTRFVVYGSGFYGDDLGCKFGSVSVPASKVSDFQVVCYPPSVPTVATNTTLTVLRAGVESAKSFVVTLVARCCPDTCLNGGACSNTPTGVSCNCTGTNYTGTNCQTPPSLPPSCAITNTPSISIASAIGSQTFWVNVVGNTNATVTVTLTSNCLYLSRCNLTFTPSTVNIPQTISAYSNPTNTARNCWIFITASGDLCNNKTSSVAVTQFNPKSASASSWGDPHFGTFDGKHYTYFGIGDFYFLRQLNGELVIQTRQDACGTVSCNYAVAVKYKSVVIYVYIHPSGAPTINTVGSPTSVGMTFVNQGTTFTLTTPTGVTIKISSILVANSNLYFLGVTATVSSLYAQQVVGLAGYFDDNIANDLLFPNGTVGQNTNEFGDSWAVPASQNLFLSSSAVIPAILGGQQSADRTIDLTCAIISVPGDVASILRQASNSPLSQGGVPSGQAGGTCDFTNATRTKEALDFCSPVFNDTVAKCCASIGVSGNDYLLSCLCDHYLMGPSIAYENAQAFYDSCNVKTRFLGASCNSCPKACLGRGTCNKGTCVCNAGYRGVDCGEDWTLPPVVVSVDKTEFPAGCANEVILYGRNFFGSNLTCALGNTLGVAFKISDYEAFCRLPLNIATGNVPLTITRAGVRSSPITLTYLPSCCYNPCLNKGRCFGPPLSTQFTCNCTGTGFTGNLCQNQIDNCASNPCKNGGRCTNLVNAYSCNCTGTGFRGNNCEKTGICAALGNDANATWPAAAVGATSYGTCLPAFFGTPSRVCLSTGFFGPVSKPCQPQGNACTAGNVYKNANWPITAPGQTATGTCVSGFSGSPTRKCGDNGGWQELVNNHCVRNSCPLKAENGTTFPATLSNTNVTGTCDSGLFGTPTRRCNADGTWGAIQGRPCGTVFPCPAETYGRAVWPQTNPGQPATGTCAPGFVNGATGAPTRTCSALGVWSTNVARICVRP